MKNAAPRDFFEGKNISLNVYFCIEILSYVECWKHQNHQVLKSFPFGYLFEFFLLLVFLSFAIFIILKLNKIEIICMSKVRENIKIFKILPLNFKFYKIFKKTSTHIKYCSDFFQIYFLKM